MSVRLRAAVAVGMLALVGSACDSTAPLAPSQIVFSSTTVSLDAIGASATVQATVLDQHDDPMPDETVTWSVSSGAVAIAPLGALGVRITAVANGTAQVTGTTRKVTSTISVAVAQAAGALVVLDGDAQIGVVGEALAVPARVRIQDRLGAPIGGHTVTFAVTSGGGSLSAASVATDPTGIAATTWTLGTTTSVAHSLRASVAGATAAAQFTATARAGPPAVVAAHAGNAQTTIVGAIVATPPAVRVTDSFGNPVPDVPTAFAPLGGGGTVAGANALTNADGIATVGAWTLGTVPGEYGLSAVVGALAPVNFLATALVGPPSSLSVVAGNNQGVAAGTPVPVRPAVRVADVFDNAIAGAAVVFAVTSGGGTATGLSTTTDASGVATVGGWTLGGTPGVNTLSAAVVGAVFPGNPVVISANALGNFDVTLRFLSALTPSQTAAFASAATRWRSIISTDIPDVPAVIGGGTCGANSTPINETLDDVLIFVTIAPIDGVGGVLGSAGPCFIRTLSGLTAVGQMRFDIADVAALEANGSFQSVVLHEMGHVLGIGTLWPNFGLLASPSPVGGPPLDTHFTGANGILGFNAIGGLAYTGGQKVPVENGFGAGTINSHWRESVLQNELMTGFLNAGANPLSELTVRSLADLGYTVVPSAADAFSLALGVRAETLGNGIQLRNDVIVGPLYSIDPQGRITRVR